MTIAVINLLHAHVEVYLKLKEAAAVSGRSVQIGIVKDLFQFHPYKWHSLFDHFLAWQCDQLFNKQIIRFLQTGKFR